MQKDARTWYTTRDAHAAKSAHRVPSCPPAFPLPIVLNLVRNGSKSDDDSRCHCSVWILCMRGIPWSTEDVKVRRATWAGLGSGNAFGTVVSS